MINKKNLSLLNTVFSLPSPPTKEDALRDYFYDYFDGRVSNVGKDAMGNVSAHLKGDPKKGVNILLTGHMDEIAFIVSGVDEKGFLDIMPLGGFDRGMIQGRLVNVFTSKGVIKGLIGKRPIHSIDDDSEVDEIYEMYVDIGETDVVKVNKMVSIGDIVLWDTGSTLGALSKNVFYGTAADNKLSVYIIMRVLDNLLKYPKRSPLVNTVYGVLTPSEEIGLGIGFAGALAEKVNPTASIVLDVTESCDYPDSFVDSISIDGGPVIETGVSINRRLKDFLIKSSNKLNINYQMNHSTSVSHTTIDGILCRKGGIPSMLISAPIRYMHTPYSVFDMRSVEETIKLVTYVCKNLHKIKTFIP
jgi:endoglucanase